MTHQQRRNNADRFINSLGMEFVWIEPGTFMMGSSEDEPGRIGDEVQHEVTLTRGYYLQTTPVTQGQWEAMMGSNPSDFKDGGPDCPVERVAWFDDVHKFIRKLNERGEGKYRLPTEAEWEYACRAGSGAAYSFGADTEELGRYAWFAENSENRTHPVGRLKPNAWGLYTLTRHNLRFFE